MVEPKLTVHKIIFKFFEIVENLAKKRLLTYLLSDFLLMFLVALKKVSKNNIEPIYSFLLDADINVGDHKENE